MAYTETIKLGVVFVCTLIVFFAIQAFIDSNEMVSGADKDGVSPSALVDLSSPESKAGYSIGANIGMNMVRQQLSDAINVDALLQGIAEGINGNLRMTENDIVSEIEVFNARQLEKNQIEAALQLEKSKIFLTANALESEVIVSPSGLQYRVLRIVDEDVSSPVASDTVNVHYHGTLIDGTVFDSSIDRGEPISFALNSVIPGWTEGLQLMKVGEKFHFFIPPELGYGSDGLPVSDISPNSVLIFEVELLGIE